jgi:DNA-binding MarR family transcriptional regulator
LPKTRQLERTSLDTERSFCIVELFWRSAAVTLNDLIPHIEALSEHYARHRSIPPLSDLARLWGYRAKSWAAAIVAELKQQAILESAPGRRLRPGAKFPFRPKQTPRAPSARARTFARNDPIEAAAAVWATEVSGTAAEAYAVVIRIATLAGLMEREFRREAHSIGLSAGEVMVLDALRRLGPPYESSAALLKDHFLISFAGIGKRVKRLERLGHVERSVNPKDRRIQTVRLTASALAMLRKRFRHRYAKHIRAVMELSLAERRQLARTLRQLQRRIDSVDPVGRHRTLRPNPFTE